MRDLASSVVVITGGTSGIGRGIARAFARRGADVVVTGRRAEHLDETRREFADAGLAVDARQVDVTDRDAMLALADDVERAHGRVDVLVNNAGLGLTGPVATATPADWDWLIDVNIRGVGNGILAFLPKIRAHGEGGHIVNTASMGGLMPIVAGLYSMTKAAVIALSEAMHIELAPDGIGVSAYCPGPVHSNIGAGAAHRPEKYGASGYPAPDPSRPGLDREQPYQSAEEAGERVGEGVRRGDMFILTHPEFKAGLIDRHRTIEQAFPDEPIDERRAAAIPFLTASPVYEERHRNPPPTWRA
ncbi:SDR family NAD(P)-dependent oxidoreductase [Microbacterium sediminis]|uniref:Ketoreductase domain-containing protein n=1 Tax=Microbacterium sediminis TaxID=904291 RepID=A0A1B9NID3_9MICO|nr:SDR family NAD(P)-dependent oxidoreductase [Microbacterium sediminis]OCG76345.1 hypothetical protein A7J15_12075 [Microbacterium sediminis]